MRPSVLRPKLDKLIILRLLLPDMSVDLRHGRQRVLSAVNLMLQGTTLQKRVLSFCGFFGKVTCTSLLN
jgi:hypothetical protein